MRMLVDAFTLLAVTAGLFFFLAGSIALLRFPDALSRLHGLTKADNLGLGLIVLGLLAQADSFAGALKLILVWLLVQFASASAGRLLARAALREPAPRDGRSS